MKAKFHKILILLLVGILAFSLSGCDALDYREAIDLYNVGEYDAAAEMFAALGDYEDSAKLVTRSHYWAAVTRMEQGNYEEALPRFLKLQDYEDSAQRVTECKYQIAIAQLEAGDFSKAEAAFLELSDYRDTSEYLRRITWQKFFDAVKAAGTENEGSFTIQKEQNNRLFCITAHTAQPDQLIFSTVFSKDMGYTFYDDLVITLSRDSLDAAFTASSTFAMDFVGTQIGSQQKMTGKLDITTCNADTVLTAETFEMTLTDNQGKTSASTDPADCLMAEDLAESYTALLDAIPQMLTKAGIELTLRDIGFSALA